jgi:cysteine sulfinate desulfinase/cysteine desulfurase-like protein
VLQALGHDEALAGNALRISVGRFNTDAEVDFAIDYLLGRIEACRRQIPGERGAVSGKR